MTSLLSKRKNDNGALKAFLTCGLLSAIIFIPFIIAGKGIFYYVGDFNGQQIPFYMHCHELVRSGFPSWDFSTELGNNFWGSYTYYTLCSPFFWLTLPFPTSWVPYLMGPVYILKFACAGLTSYLYIRYFTKTEGGALMGSVLYAFCGWSTFNIFYNQFHESFIIFPLLLLSLENLVNENKKGWFAVTVAASAIINYYFFVGMVVFVVIYWAIKTITKSWQMSFKKFLWIFLEALLGTLAATFVLLPSAITVFSMSRTGSYINGWGFWIYENPGVYFYIIQSMLFPAEIPAIQSFSKVDGIAWQSLSLYIPLFGVIGILTYIQRNKKEWKSKLLIISFIMALIPGLNASFTAFQNIYYARWFMMPILIMCMVTAISLEEYSFEDFKKSYRFISIITVAIILIVLLTPQKIEDSWHIGIWNRNEGPRFVIFLFFSAIAVLQILLLYIFGNNKESLLNNKRIKQSLVLIIVTTIFFTVAIGRSTSANGFVVESSMSLAKNKEELDIKDNERVTAFIGDYNITVPANINCIDFFHSLAPEGTIGVYDSLFGFKRGVCSYISADNPYFRAISSVKYEIVQPEYVDKYTSLMSDESVYVESVDKLKEKYGYSLTYGYEEKDIDFDENFLVFENKNYIPMGIGYKYYLKQSDYDALDDNLKGKTIMNSLIIPDEKENEYSSVLLNYRDILDISGYYSDSEYSSDCKNKLTCVEYKQNNSGFTAKFNADERQMVMFSVSSDNNGWTAYVNGKEAPIHKVDGGFMAVEVAPGENNISFKYSTPGLKEGISVSIVGFVGIVAIFVFGKKKKMS